MRTQVRNGLYSSANVGGILFLQYFSNVMVAGYPLHRSLGVTTSANM